MEEPSGPKGPHGSQIKLMPNCISKRESHGGPKEKPMKAPRVPMRAPKEPMKSPREPVEDPRGPKGPHSFNIQLMHSCILKRESHGEPKERPMKAPRLPMRAPKESMGGPRELTENPRGPKGPHGFNKIQLRHNCIMKRESHGESKEEPIKASRVSMGAPKEPMMSPREPTDDPRGPKGPHGSKIQLVHNCILKRESHRGPKEEPIQAHRVPMRAPRRP